MACDAEQLILENTGIIGPQIFEKNLEVDAWADYIKTQVWENHLGSSYKFTRFERLVPGEVTYTNVVSGNGTTSPCEPTVTELPFPGQTTVSVNLQQALIRTPDLCLQDINIAVNAEQILNIYVDYLAQATKWVFMRRHMVQYTDGVTNKVIAQNGNGFANPRGTATFPLVEPTSQLTQNMLNSEYVRMNYNGAGERPYARVNRAPIYALFSDMETFENLIKNNADLRQDVRFSSEVNMLIGPLGETRTFRNFAHINIEFPRRWNFTGGAWVEVLPYDTANPVPTTIGGILEVTEEYMNAPYQDAYIIHELAYQMLVPNTQLTFGKGKIKFDPQNYRGEYQWLNIRGLVCDGQPTNLLGNTGFFLGHYMFGSMYPRPELGTVIRHLRCGFGDDSVGCYGS